MFENSFKSVIENLVKNRNEFQESLASLPFQREIFSKKELGEVIKINKQLGEITSYLHGNNADDVVKILNRVFESLDNMGIWKSKFSTGEQTPNPQRDSVYYTTPSGLSLRFKMANITKNIDHIIQPFMENIHFIGDSTKPLKRLPEIGMNTYEFLSREFFELQNSNSCDSPFESQVKIYYKNGAPYHFSPPPNLYHRHPGNAVNRIFFIR